MESRTDRKEHGQILVLIILAIVGMFGFAALAIDGGMTYFDRRNAQSAADAASLAGALSADLTARIRRLVAPAQLARRARRLVGDLQVLVHPDVEAVEPQVFRVGELPQPVAEPREPGALGRHGGVGALADRIGPKPALFIALLVYAGVTVLGYFLMNESQFFALAFLVGLVQGGSQALSRSLFARMTPRAKSSEYFGFFAVFEKFAGIFGPAVFAATSALAGSGSQAILSVIAFFIVGAVLLARVNVDEGQRAARESGVG